ncbi:hypothetical protein GCM10009867_26660 [Pedococcus aerophilus]|uniref:HTH cro/C1-type domain-containing protein n=1 Tax=Pedococcus aerophilus TaxID=436356 RepID=A0ABP6HAX8_9MICO
MINSLGVFVQDQMSLLGWNRAVLAERTGIDEWTIATILDSHVLAGSPDTDDILALARAFSMPVREIVLRAAEGCGLHVMAPMNPTETLLLASNDELMSELRRRLALGARTGGYLAAPAQRWDVEAV